MQMNESLRTYMESIRADIDAYKKGTLTTKNYLQSMEDLNKWLEENKR